MTWSGPESEFARDRNVTGQDLVESYRQCSFKRLATSFGDIVGLGRDLLSLPCFTMIEYRPFPLSSNIASSKIFLYCSGGLHFGSRITVSESIDRETV